MIATISESAWTAIRYPKAIWERDEERWVSDAEVAEIQCSAFTRKAKRYRATARLMVRRVKRLNGAGVPDGQGELFTVWRFHAVFTDSLLPLVEAEADHRRHAVVEQVFADLEDSALGHLPSGKFTANAAWLALAAVAHNLTRALGTLASASHAWARTGTVGRRRPHADLAPPRALALAGGVRRPVDNRRPPATDLTCQPARPRPRTSETLPPGRPPGNHPRPPAGKPLNPPRKTFRVHRIRLCGSRLSGVGAR
ncbi:hypothetical protein ABIA33_006909 [Streptacidiphilus sp. MAP12-16]|uniref:hypothetical protein n=1 Tax=Streptacidiphilus sp. MAP12-16 TaxID=3156300 RepID=UPI003513DE13